MPGSPTWHGGSTWVQPRSAAKRFHLLAPKHLSKLKRTGAIGYQEFGARSWKGALLGGEWGRSERAGDLVSFVGSVGDAYLLGWRRLRPGASARQVSAAAAPSCWAGCESTRRPRPAFRPTRAAAGRALRAAHSTSPCLQPKHTHTHTMYTSAICYWSARALTHPNTHTRRRRRRRRRRSQVFAKLSCPTRQQCVPRRVRPTVFEGSDLSFELFKGLRRPLQIRAFAVALSGSHGDQLNRWHILLRRALTKLLFSNKMF